MAKNVGLINNSKALLDSIAFHKKYWKERHYPRIVDQYSEEASELIQAFMKERRKRDVQENIEEEIADVLLCLEFIVRVKKISKQTLNKRINAKAKRIVASLAIGKE